MLALEAMALYCANEVRSGVSLPGALSSKQIHLDFSSTSFLNTWTWPLT